MKTNTTEELKNMNHQEGLILQGCGGDLQEWIDGINGILREQGILLDEKPLDDVSVFQHEGLTNLLFALGKHKLDTAGENHRKNCGAKTYRFGVLSEKRPEHYHTDKGGNINGTGKKEHIGHSGNGNL